MRRPLSLGGLGVSRFLDALRAVWLVRVLWLCGGASAVLFVLSWRTNAVTFYRC